MNYLLEYSGNEYKDVESVSNMMISTPTGAKVPLFDLASKLENAVKFMDKQAAAMSKNGLSLNEKTLNKELDKITDLLTSVGEKMSNLQSEKLNQNKAFSLNLNELKMAVKELLSQTAQLSVGDKFNNFAQKIIQNDDTPTLQDKLQNVARRLNFALQIADKTGFEAKNNLEELNGLIKQ